MSSPLESSATQKIALLGRVMLRLAADLKSKTYEQFAQAYSNPGGAPSAWDRQNQEVSFQLRFSSTSSYDVHAAFVGPAGPWLTAVGRGNDEGVLITAIAGRKIDVGMHLASQRRPGSHAKAVVDQLSQLLGFENSDAVEASLIGTTPPAGRIGRITDTAKTAALAPIFITWYVAGPITYVLAVVDTWHSRAAIPVKLLLNLTLDAFMASIWPAAWLIWIVKFASTGSGPIRLLYHY